MIPRTLAPLTKENARMVVARVEAETGVRELNTVATIRIRPDAKQSSVASGKRMPRKRISEKGDQGRLTST
jgi:hypothetical protein